MPRLPKGQPRFKPPASPFPAGMEGEEREREEARRMGEALRALRERRGMLQNELAEASGMTPAQVCAFERGRRSPSLRSLRRMCEALGARAEDLLRSATGREDRSAAAGRDEAVLPGLADLFQTPEQRAFAPLASLGVVRTVLADSLSSPLPPEECVRAIETRIGDYLRLEKICGAFAGASIPLSLPFAQDAAGAEALATKVRRHLGLGDAIVLDYVSVLESHGIRVLFLALPPGLGSIGFHDSRSGSAVFAVSDSITPEKQLFRLALELAWLYLFTRNGNGPVPEAAENNRRFAKLFAACFLMPRGSVQSMAESLGARRGGWTYPLLLRVKRHYGVSAEALAYRLLELRLIDSHALSGFLGSIREHYATHQNREPGEPAPPLVRNGRFADLLERGRVVPGAYDEVRSIARRAGIQIGL